MVCEQRNAASSESASQLSAGAGIGYSSNGCTGTQVGFHASAGACSADESSREATQVCGQATDTITGSLNAAIQESNIENYNTNMLRMLNEYNVQHNFETIQSTDITSTTSATIAINAKTRDICRTVVHESTVDEINHFCGDFLARHSIGYTQSGGDVTMTQEQRAANEAADRAQQALEADGRTDTHLGSKNAPVAKMKLVTDISQMGAGGVGAWVGIIFGVFLVLGVWLWWCRRTSTGLAYRTCDPWWTNFCIFPDWITKSLDKLENDLKKMNRDDLKNTVTQLQEVCPGSPYPEKLQEILSLSQSTGFLDRPGAPTELWF